MDLGLCLAAAGLFGFHSNCGLGCWLAVVSGLECCHVCTPGVSGVCVIPEQCRVFILGLLARVASGRSALVSAGVLFIIF